MKHTPAVRLAIASLIGLLLQAGCGGGDELDRQAVSGTVTLDGEPLPQGAIQFSPTSEDQPVMSGGVIQDGKFSIPRAEGPVPGHYKVSITASPTEAVIPEQESEMPGVVLPPPPSPIPARYNTSTTLTADIEDGGDNEFTFDLERAD